MGTFWLLTMARRAREKREQEEADKKKEDEIKRKEEEIVLKLAAFASLKKRGLEFASRVYPKYIEFFNANKHKTYEEVKKELLNK